MFPEGISNSMQPSQPVRCTRGCLFDHRRHYYIAFNVVTLTIVLPTLAFCLAMDWLRSGEEFSEDVVCAWQRRDRV